MRLRMPTSVHLTLLAVVLVGGAFQWGYVSASSRYGDRRRTAVVDAVEHASPAVVSVNAWNERRRTKGAGSGVIVHPDGFVVTNSHVIRGASRITVQLFRSQRNINARVVANDARGDLAMLKLEGRRRWPYVSLSPTSGLLLGEPAVAIGNPRGLGDSITVGVISAVRRSAKASSGGTFKNLIQTDAPINTGNSGGPLLNLDGELIGINTSVLPSAEGIAFAIPADDVKRMLVRAVGREAPRKPIPEATRPHVPTEPPPLVSAPRREPESIASSKRERLPAPPEVERDAGGWEPKGPITPLRPIDLGLEIGDDGCRLVLRKVLPRSPASGAGFLTGDVLLEIDGFPVENLDDAVLAFQANRPGHRYAIRARRGNNELYVIMVSPR